MASSQILSMGSVVKYRGEYDDSTVYYYLNMVTMYGSVFEMNGNNISGIPPLIKNDDGTISLANTSTWTVIVDNTALYNAALSKVPLADQIKTLQTNYETLSTSLSTERKSREDGDTDIKSMIGKNNGSGIAETSNGKIDSALLPDDIFSVVMLDAIVTTENGKVIMPSDVSLHTHYYYDAYAKKLYNSFYMATTDVETGKTNVQQGWHETTMEKNKIYIDSSNADIYLYKENNGLVKVLPQTIPSLVYLTQDEYDKLVSTGRVDENTCYNILEEE